MYGFSSNRAFMVLGRPVVAPQCRNVKTGLATGAGRENDWKKAWTCRGTRKSQDPKGRDKYLGRLTRKGEPEWIAKFDLEALVIAHELSPPDVFDTYLYDVSRPVRPLLSYGRSAKVEPPCQPREVRPRPLLLLAAELLLVVAAAADLSCLL